MGKENQPGREWRQSGPGYEVNIIGDTADMQLAPRFELFLLGPDEKKCSEAADTRECFTDPPQITYSSPNLFPGTPNSSVFTFKKEDHTLANMIRGALLKDVHITFAGYKGAHISFGCQLHTD